MGTSYTQKLLELDIQLDQNPVTNQIPGFTQVPTTFPSGGNTVTISNARTIVRIQHSGLPSGSTAQIQVLGLTPDLMNQLSTLGQVWQVIPHNTLSVRAGDVVSGLSICFVGSIWSAVPDFSRAPDGPFTFECTAQLINQVVPAKASSYPQSTDVATIMSSLAGRMGYSFENNGINAKLPPTYLYGTLLDQVKQVKDAANIEAEIVPAGLLQNQLTLAIWPKGGSRSSNKSIPLVSPSTGMIGYPAYSAVGLTVKTLFNPQIIYGGQIQIQSALPKASGIWTVLDISHALDSQVPDGLWESTLICFNPNYAAKFGVPTPI